MAMKVLIIGSGGREHAIAKACARSKHAVELFCIGSSLNPGIRDMCKEFIVDSTTHAEKIADTARQWKIDLAIIGPESSLESGVSDTLELAGVPCIGPKKKLARIETSKCYARDLLSDALLPGLVRYQVFHEMKGVPEFLHSLDGNYVIKADGLMSGKGVKVSGDHLQNVGEAIRYCEQLTALGSSFVIEEKLFGVEFSLMSFTDGYSLAHMPVVQDYKRALDHDQGPNTGGMGSITDFNHTLPFLLDDEVKLARSINEQSLRTLCSHESERYVGILYGGYMATKDGVKLIEFNARFGDPESINVLGCMQTDIIDVLTHCVEGTLSRLEVAFEPVATVCKYAVPNGYPDHPVKGEQIDISVLSPDADMYFAGIDERDGILYETGSRALAVLAKASTITEAGARAEAMIASVAGPVFHRTDIGTSDLLDARIAMMNSIRR